MKFRIDHITHKKLVGKCITTSIVEDRTMELWRSFMPRKKEIKNIVGPDLYSLQIYPKLFFKTFNFETEFIKWAAIEVDGFTNQPKDLETLILAPGMYAIFNHVGAQTNLTTFEYIFKTWLPNSADYALDNRPHFEILGEKYKNGDGLSEEEIWIPVKQINKNIHLFKY